MKTKTRKKTKLFSAFTMFFTAPKYNRFLSMLVTIVVAAVSIFFLVLPKLEFFGIHEWQSYYENILINLGCSGLSVLFIYWFFEYMLETNDSRYRHQARELSYLISDLRKVGDHTGDPLKKAKKQKIIDQMIRQDLTCLPSKINSERFDFEGIDFTGLNFNKAKFNGLYARGTKFHDCTFVGCLFKNGNLSEAEFHGANLTDAHLDTVSMREVKFVGATLTLARFLKETYIAGADFSDADLTSAYFDKEAEYSSKNVPDILYNLMTTLPNCEKPVSSNKKFTELLFE